MALKTLLIAFTIFYFSFSGKAQQADTFTNPILKGFYPDPSICRVGDDFYLVNSSFEYFPGVPIFHSKDLVNWQQIGYVLNRSSQLNLDTVRASGGIYAATIRYNKGTFYMITTLLGSQKNGNFIVTAKSASGPWSEPKWIAGAPGIDPSLFFDDDGKVYYTGNKKPNPAPNPTYRQIWLQELDVENAKLLGEPKVILEEGALYGANNVEGPHLYKKDGFYYLLVAEGGTGENHAVTIFRSSKITGPYEGNKKNPIITHRNLGHNYPISTIGHADIVDTKNGEWWMVSLGVRNYGNGYANLGRETFLAKIEWEGGWPVVNPGEGKILTVQKRPNLPAYNTKKETLKDDFTTDTLYQYWNFMRTPRTDFWSVSKRKGFLRLRLLPEEISQQTTSSFVGRRQQDTSFTAETAIQFSPKKENEVAGLVVLMNQNFQYRCEQILEKDQLYVQLVKRVKGKDELINKLPVNKGELIMGIKAKGQAYSFYIKQQGLTQVLKNDADGRILSVRTARGFTGAYLGLFASSRGIKSGNFADFDWFNYIPQ